MTVKSFIENRVLETKIFFVIFYAVGIAGLLLPFSFPLFVRLVPLALLLSFTGLAIFHPDKTEKKPLLIFLAVFIMGYVVEAIGVNTGLIFGEYKYGDSLGPKIYFTPVIIGLNWLFLVYTTASVFEKVKIHPLLKIIFASSLMLVYDLVLEQLAPVIDMWYWIDDIVPLKNYLAWFVIALIFHALLKVARIQIQNKLAALILICQFLFFLILYFFLR
jgi:putative membrane protein